MATRKVRAPARISMKIESLYAAFMKMVGNGVGRLPVVEASSPNKLMGIITRVDIGNLYDSEVKSILERNKASEKP